MQTSKLPLNLHRALIVLACLMLMVLLMQGASWFSLSRQKQLSAQAEELSQTLASQVAFSLVDDLEQSPADTASITQTLNHLTQNSRILDASVYDANGNLVVSRGQKISLRDRLALEGERSGSHFTRQVVQPLTTEEGRLGFLRLTLDTHLLATETRQVDNTTNLLRLMLLLALAIGIILARTLLRDQRTHWQQSPFLLTAGRKRSADAADEKQADVPPA